MGRGMAERLIAAGHDVRVLAHRSREAVEALVAAGATEAPDLDALAADVDAVALCVPNAAVSSARVRALSERLPAGALVIDLSTVTPEAAVANAAMLAARGVDFVEAPVSGGPTQAAEGALGALVGATPAAFQRAQPLLAAFCAEIAHFGPPGAGARAKLLYNFMALGMAALVIETFNRADAAGVDWEKLYAVATRGSADGGVLRRIIGGALSGDPQGYRFSVANAAKDLTYFCALAEAEAVPGQGGSALGAAARAVFAEAEAEGRGAEMISELASRAAPRDPGDA